jgi:hypothetical protein
MAQSFAIGVNYYGVRESLGYDCILTPQTIFYIPIFLQYVKSYNALVAGAFVLVYTFPQALWGIGGGFYIAKTNHYKRVVVSVIYTHLSPGPLLMYRADSRRCALDPCLGASAPLDAYHKHRRSAGYA